MPLVLPQPLIIPPPLLLFSDDFFPSDVPGIIADYDASVASSVFQDAAGLTPAGDGDVIGHIADQSTAGANPLTQATTSKKALYQTNDLNGLAIAEFDGVDDYLQAELGALANPISIFVVTYFEQLAQSGFDYVLNLGDGTGAPGAASNISVSREDITGKYYTFDGTSIFADPVITGQVWNIYSILHDSSAPFHNMWLNGAAQSVLDYPATISTAGTFQWGALAESNHLEGKIVQSIIYNNLVSTTNRILLQTHLSNKYGIALS